MAGTRMSKPFVNLSLLHMFLYDILTSVHTGFRF